MSLADVGSKSQAKGVKTKKRKVRDESTKLPTIDPLSVAQSLGYQTFRREGRQPWTKEEDALLKKLTLDEIAANPGLKELDNLHWERICEQLGSASRKPKDCRKRFASSLDPNLRRGKWEPEEDEKLLEAYKKYGASWQKVSMSIEGRTDDQCAKRYMEVLDPKIKDRLRTWDREEDLELIRKVKRYGTKWRTISAEMQGRPSLTCRNRWRKIVTDVMRGKAELAISQEVNIIKADTKIDLGEDAGVDAKSDNNKESKYKASPKDSPMLDASRENTPLTHLSNVLQNQLNGARHESQPIQQDPPINLSMYNAVPNRNHISSPRPIQSGTDWKYSLTSPQGEEIPNGFGTIDSQETAQRLIDLAKAHGISVTVHQHITHHYAPQQQTVLEPETQLGRYQHFNYLPPLTEVPKLNSSNSSPAGSSGGSNSKESDLIKLLNTDGSKNGTGAMSPPLHYRDGRSPKRSRFNPNNFRPTTHSYGTSRQQLYPTTGATSPSSKSLTQPRPSVAAKPQLITEDLEEEMDFWETMKSFTSPLPHTQPVSRHHPLHYQQQHSDAIKTNVHSNYHPSHQANYPPSNAPSGTFRAVYGYNEEDEDEMDEDDERAHSGDYYTGNGVGQEHHSLEYNQRVMSDAESNSSDAQGSQDSDELGIGSFGYFPFNPS